MIKLVSRFSRPAGIGTCFHPAPRSMASSGPKQLQANLIKKFKADRLAEAPYHNKLWQVSEEESQADARKLEDTVRVLYLARYIKESEITKLITHVPYICTAGDSYIQTQDLKVQSSLDAARRSFPDLISNEERRLSRSKCIASVAKCYAVGGYKSKVQALRKSDVFDCVVISGAGPQFEAPYLDFADFILTKEKHKERLDRYSHFGPIPGTWSDIVAAAENGRDFIEIKSKTHVFHKTGYLISMTECMHLWLTAFDHMVPLVSKNRRGYFKISAIGCGFFSDVADADTNIGTRLMPLLVGATEAALKTHRYPNIASIEFCDFSKDGSFAPTGQSVNGVDTTHGPRSDVLDFSKQVQERRVPGLLNPSDCFACVGNETRYLSVESMIGDNTTIRTTQCYLWNEQVLDSRWYHAVKDDVVIDGL